MRTRAFLLAILFGFGAPTDAWSQGAPLRDPSRGAARGTAGIRGRVTDDAGKLLRRARINPELVVPKL